MGITKRVAWKLVSYFNLQLSVRSQLMVGFQLIQKRVSGSGKYPAIGLEQTLSFYLGFLEVASVWTGISGWCRKHKTVHSWLVQKTQNFPSSDARTGQDSSGEEDSDDEEPNNSTIEVALPHWWILTPYNLVSTFTILLLNFSLHNDVTCTW